MLILPHFWAKFPLQDCKMVFIHGQRGVLAFGMVICGILMWIRY